MSAELAGLLRERVTIQRRGPGRDALGGAVGEWTTIAEAWAAVAPADGGPVVAGGALAAMPWWRVTLRAPSAAAMGDRMIWRGRRLMTRRITADPRLPDRVECMMEEER